LIMSRFQTKASIKGRLYYKPEDEVFSSKAEMRFSWRAATKEKEVGEGKINNFVEVMVLSFKDFQFCLKKLDKLE